MSAIPVTDRAGYIGGSDWTSVLGVEPYGCPRRAWYAKRGEQPDYPEDVTPPMQRGTEMEEIVVRLYLDDERAELARGPRPRAKDMPSWWIGHEDRIIVHPARGKGVLEAKTAGGYVWRAVKRDGLHLGYVAQAMHYIGLTGLPYCDLAMLWPDGWQRSVWTIERDDELLSAMRGAGDTFMRQVEHGPAPDRLDAKDRRCQRCPFRTSCQGAALYAAVADDTGDVERIADDELEMLIREERDAAELVTESEQVRDVLREKIKQHIWHKQAVEVPGFRVYFRPRTSRRFDTKAFRNDNPELAQKYDREIVTRPLVIYSI